MYSRHREGVPLVRTECGIVGYRSHTSHELREERDRQIAAGKIDIGKSICPIEETTMRINKDTGMLQTVKSSYMGRQIPLKDIRQRHLEMMNKWGLLRETDFGSKSAEELEQLLDQRKSKIRQLIYIVVSNIILCSMKLIMYRLTKRSNSPIKVKTLYCKM